MNMYSKNASRIIEFLLRHIPEEFNVNQIARQLQISAGGAHHILKKLQNKEILNRRKAGNAIYYKLNLENSETRKIGELLLIESAHHTISSNPAARIYASDLENVSRIAYATILFGSILTRKEHARDVDVFFLVDRKTISTIEKMCIDLAKVRTKTIHPLFMTRSDFKRNIAKKDAVTSEILRTGSVISGENEIIDVLRGI